MKPEAQRIAIAETCGWQWMRKQFQHYTNGKNHRSDLVKPGAIGIYKQEGWELCTGPLPIDIVSDDTGVPDYLNDLNAMHEAAAWMRANGNQFQWLDYTKNLFRCVWKRDATSDDCVTSGLSWDVIEATAAHRAEAFLKAKGLWQV